MILKNVTHLLLVIALLSLSAISVYAQDASLLWIKVNDHQGSDVTMYYGNGSTATYYVDDGTGGTTQYFESIAPPPPPSGFDARWKGIPGRNNAAIVDGLFPRDYRAVPSNATQKDTFQLQFGNSDVPDTSMYFSWPDATYLGLHCDSMFIIYSDPNLGAQKIDMFASTSLEIQAAGTNGITFFRIWKYGAKIIDGVKQNPNVIPETFSLQQNYPNPFNPSTTIKFDIQQRAITDISVYNILGQKIATLVTGQLSQGEYSTVWNGTSQNGLPVSSGVYFVRMNARVEQTGEVFTGLRKLLLMK